MKGNSCTILGSRRGQHVISSPYQYAFIADAQRFQLLRRLCGLIYRLFVLPLASFVLPFASFLLPFAVGPALSTGSPLTRT